MSNVVIFDMDGVIVDSEPLNDRHHAKLLESLGVTHEQISLPSFRGIGSKLLWTTVKNDAGLSQSVVELIRQARQSYLDFLEALPEIPAVPGAIELMEALKGSGYRLALASSANPKRVELFLKRLGLTSYFEVIASTDDVEHGKPAPDIYLHAAKLLGCPPEDCWVIEDAKAGVASAKTAGMTCLGFTGLEDNHEDLSAADYEITDLAALSRQIKEGKKLSSIYP